MLRQRLAISLFSTAKLQYGGGSHTVQTVSIQWVIYAIFSWPIGNIDRSSASSITLHSMAGRDRRQRLCGA